MSKKVNWAEVDKRIRNRRVIWTPDERQAVEESLKKLPDLTEQSETLTLAQPAVGGGDEDDDDDDAN